MTVIVYDPTKDEVLVDSSYSWSNGRSSISAAKIDEYRGWKFAAAGAVIDRPFAHLVIDSIVEGQLIVRGIPKAECVSMITRAPDGRVFLLNKEDDVDYGVAVCVTGTCHDWVLGCGGNFYSAYRAAGHDCRTATEMTAMYHRDCGMPIESF